MTKSRSEVSTVTPTRAIFLLSLAALALFIVRATAPHNFLDKDQERPASYILDAVLNRHWICQTDWMGDITSKPPMLTWIGVLLTKTFGAKPWIFFVPSALAWTALAFLMYAWTRHYFGESAALFSGLLLILSPIGMRLFILLRTDALFAFTVALTAACAWRMWRTGRGVTSFWLAAAAATLTKGPLGVLLGSFGLAAAFFERRSAQATRGYRQHLWGVALYILLVGGWFAASYYEWGDPVAEKLIRRELIAHAAHMEHPDPWFARLPKPSLYFLHRMLPWSLLALAGMWRVIRHPASDAMVNRLNRFLMCWFLLGLTLFSLAQHQRADLLAPILAPAMIFAAREFMHWIGRWKPRADGWIAALLIGGALVQAFYYYHFVEAKNPMVLATEKIRHCAAQWSRRRSSHPPLQFVDVPYTLQLYLGTMRTNISIEAAAAQLASNQPTCVAVSREAAARIRSQLRGQDHKVFVLAECENEVFPIAILANYPDDGSIGPSDEHEPDDLRNDNRHP